MLSTRVIVPVRCVSEQKKPVAVVPDGSETGVVDGPEKNVKNYANCEQDGPDN